MSAQGNIVIGPAETHGKVFSFTLKALHHVFGGLMMLLVFYFQSLMLRARSRFNLDAEVN
jgi:hypothetical protein